MLESCVVTLLPFASFRFFLFGLGDLVSLVGWLVGCFFVLFCWLLACLVSWLLDCLVAWQVGRRGGGLVGRWVGT